jgi:uncharacterized delta-60 repeat protein
MAPLRPLALTLFLVGLLFTFLLLSPRLALAQGPGDLDPSFDGDGLVTTNFLDIGSGQAYAVALQPNGKIVVAGYSSNGLNQDFAVVRYNTDGSLDPTFDGDGKVTTPISNSTDIAYAVALQPDGKIVAAGYTYC